MAIIRGTVAGALAGLAATYVMTVFQDAWQGRKPAAHAGEPAAARAAERAAEPVLDRPLSGEEKAAAGPAVHYAFGAAVGAFYGGASELVSDLRMAAGLPFGAAVWLVADELAVPAAGLADRAAERTRDTRLYALASHLVYGVSLEVTRRVVRTVLAVV